LEVLRVGESCEASWLEHREVLTRKGGKREKGGGINFIAGIKPRKRDIKKKLCNGGGLAQGKTQNRKKLGV